MSQKTWEDRGLMADRQFRGPRARPRSPRPQESCIVHTTGTGVDRRHRRSPNYACENYNTVRTGRAA